MRADITSLKQKKENFCSLFKQMLDDAHNGESFNYNKMFNIFEQLKIIISEAKKIDEIVSITLTAEIEFE